MSMDKRVTACLVIGVCTATMGAALLEGGASSDLAAPPPPVQKPVPPPIAVAPCPRLPHARPRQRGPLRRTRDLAHGPPRRHGRRLRRLALEPHSDRDRLPLLPLRARPLPALRGPRERHEVRQGGLLARAPL